MGLQVRASFSAFRLHMIIHGLVFVRTVRTGQVGNDAPISMLNT